MGGNPRRQDSSLALAIALVTREEEQLVFQNRASDVGAKLVLSKRRTLDATRIGEEIIGVQHLVADELVCRAVKGVCAGLGREVDDSAGKSPVFRAEIVGLDFKFLNGILRRYDSDNVQVRSIGWHAVDQDLALSGHTSANLKVSQGEGVSADGIARRGIAS